MPLEMQVRLAIQVSFCNGSTRDQVLMEVARTEGVLETIGFKNLVGWIDETDAIIQQSARRPPSAQRSGAKRPLHRRFGLPGAERRQCRGADICISCPN